jgi:hypothetical protein
LYLLFHARNISVSPCSNSCFRFELLFILT